MSDNVEDVGSAIVHAGERIASALRLLGNADAATPMGGLEALGVAIFEAAKEIRGGLEDVAEAVREVATMIGSDVVDG